MTLKERRTTYDNSLRMVMTMRFRIPRCNGFLVVIKISDNYVALKSEAMRPIFRFLP
jgi:hypothetical protein